MNKGLFPAPFFHALTAAAILLCAATSDATAQERPNVIVIVADDLGYNDVGYQGSEIHTPHIDHLAATGVVAEAGYVAASVCSPSRAGLMTGRAPGRFGFFSNPPQSTSPDIGLPTTETTIADVMHSAGYFTAAIGKWHLGEHPIFHPNRRGFDHFYGFLGGQHRYFSSLFDAPIERNGVPVPDPDYLTFGLGDEAIRVIDAHAGGPFFIYLAFNAPHSPMQAPQAYLDRYPNISDPVRRTYAAMVSAMDDTIARVVDRAEALSRPTLIIFLSDNGGIPKWGGNNTPLRANKGSTFEGGIRVPMIWHMAGSLTSGRYSAPLSSLDILPTIAALAGASLPAKPVDGKNIWPAIHDGALLGKRTLYWQMNDGFPTAIRDGHWKLVNDGSGNMLFDLNVWPPEREDLAASDPAKTATLRTMLSTWSATLEDPLW